MMRKINLVLALIGVLTLVLTACGGGGDEGETSESQAVGDAAHGKELYATACASCHGPNAEGVEGLGKSWMDNAFILVMSDSELLAFIKKGRSPSDPDNTTGVDMPPKGGNPALTDEDLNDIIAFMRTLQ
jgi:disulfide bond formation protein DsbB